VSKQTRSLDYRKRRRQSGSALAEFAPVLFVFLFFALFPLLDLMAVAVGTASISLAARQGSGAAAASADYGSALTAMERDVNAVRYSGFGHFLNLTPVGGSNGCGADLWIEKTDVAAQTVQYCGPNNKAPAPIDATAFIYELSSWTAVQLERSSVHRQRAGPGSTSPDSICSEDRGGISQRSVIGCSSNWCVDEHPALIYLTPSAVPVS
jgi:hypothetical protein